MAAPDRLVRVNELLKRALADYLEKDPMLKDSGVMVTIVNVKAASNLRSAEVKVSVWGDQEAKQKGIKLLYRAKSDMQHRIAHELTLKYTPVLHFVLDENIERGDRVLALIREMEQKNAGQNQ